ncbi:hypothetical protein NKR23_g7430 [Pleurostoma richardsiae]|uniref:Uncharacterized protein n=1 Tax=Pleurostoma richardsiae TaxID=41990 RepID=A0AA38RWB2_9PEZI|nr:hypothetical protein NKR23_g7430 [Pleurostoma richardsiae]
MSRRQTEILVHITAPSKASDDNKYRALAEAYLDFEPGRRTAVTAPDAAVPAPASSSRPVPSASYRQSLQSPQLSFESVWDNAGSPRIVDQRQPNKLDEASQHSWVAPPSIIADSNPENNVSIAAYCSPTRVLEHYLQQVIDSSPGSSIRDAPTGSSSGEVIRSSQPAPNTIALTESVSSIAEVIRTPSSPLRRPRRPEANFAATQDSLPLDQIASSQLSGPPDAETDVIPATARADSEPPPPKRLKRTPVKATAIQALARSASDVLPRGSHQTEPARGLSRPQASKQPILDALEIRPPDPLVSAEDLDPASLVTWKLAKLAKDMDIEKRFRPKLQVRELRPFERGYWLLDCSDWDATLKADAWIFLTNYVGNGNGGWGIWCLRDEDFTWIRIYCWGFIVGHIYLLLHLASKRKLKQCEISWYGADGEVLIVVGPRTGGLA